MSALDRRLTDAQTISLAAFERYHGRARILPRGPRCSRILEFASHDAIAVASDFLYTDPIITVVEADGQMELSEVAW